MYKNLSWQNHKSLPFWFWFLAFMISIAGIFAISLKPEYLQQYWLYLFIYNTIIILIAFTYIVKFFASLHKQNKQKIVGSKFTLSLVKIIPLLTLVPMLSFYAFSFQSVQNNLLLASKSVEKFNTTILNEADNIYRDLNKVATDAYLNISTEIIKIANSFIFNENDYSPNLDQILTRLANKDDICKLSIFFGEKKIASSNTGCKIKENYTLESKFFSLKKDRLNKVVIAQLPLRSINENAKNIVLVAFYKETNNIERAVTRVENFQLGIKNANITLNASIIQKQFLIDFATTILLTLLSILIIVFKMVEKIMVPLNNLTITSKKISSGAYGSLVVDENLDSDIKNLIEEFNKMSLQIKASKEDIEHKNLYLETIIKYSSGVIALDTFYNINLINDKAITILSLQNKHFIDKKLINIANKDDKSFNVLNIIVKHLDSQINNWHDEVELDDLLLDIQGAVLKNNNIIIGYLVVIKDISAIIKTQKLHAWNEVARKVTHEIKNPLNPILMSAQRLRNKLLPHSEAEVKQIIDKTTQTIITQVSSINDMIGSFVEYGTTPKLQYSNHNLNNIIKNVVALYDEEYNVILELGEISELQLDKNSINRVLINLIKNSIEARDDKHSLTIHIKTFQKDGNIVLEITDNGSGFDEKVVHKVFEPHFTNKKTGSGLGMAIIEKIIRQHGGTIEVDKTYKNGAKIITIFKATTNV